jgi:hypothetical protein
MCFFSPKSYLYNVAGILQAGNMLSNKQLPIFISNIIHRLNMPHSLVTSEMRNFNV